MAFIRNYRTQINFKLLNFISLKAIISHNNNIESFAHEKYISNVTSRLPPKYSPTPFFKAKFYCHLLNNLVLPDSFFRYGKNPNISNNKTRNLLSFYKEELNIIRLNSYNTIDYNNKDYIGNYYYNVIMAMANHPIDKSKNYLFI